MLTALRDFKAAVELGGALLKSPRSQRDVALICFGLGRAYFQLDLLEPAIVHLNQARQQFGRQHDQRLAADALDWEARAWGILRDPRARTPTSLALELSRTLEPRAPTLEARILGHVASLFVGAKSWRLAITHYEAAIEAASFGKDLLQMAQMHHGLGEVYMRLQQQVEARQQFDTALALYSIESDLHPSSNDLGVWLRGQDLASVVDEHIALTRIDEINAGAASVMRADLGTSF
jgi:tetratricopeptide (TPR) repeat protein